MPVAAAGGAWRVLCPKHDGRRVLFGRYDTEREAVAVRRALVAVGCPATVAAPGKGPDDGL